MLDSLKRHESEILKLKESLKAAEYEVKLLRHERDVLLSQRLQYHDHSEVTKVKLIDDLEKLKRRMRDCQTLIEHESNIILNITDAVTQKLKVDLPKEKYTSVVILMKKLKHSVARLTTVSSDSRTKVCHNLFTISLSFCLQQFYILFI